MSNVDSQVDVLLDAVGHPIRKGTRVRIYLDPGQPSGGWAPIYETKGFDIQLGQMVVVLSEDPPVWAFPRALQVVESTVERFLSGESVDDIIKESK